MTAQPSASDGQTESSEVPRLSLQQAQSFLDDIGRSEQHFNNLEIEYRKLASTWLLAGFAGMGYIATATKLALPPGATSFVIGLCTALGIQLLWLLDILTYHRLLLAYFVEGVRLEQSFPQFPQVRSNMLSQGRSGKNVRLFYLGCSMVPTAFGFIAYLYIDQEDLTKVSIAVAILGVLLLCLVGFGLYYKSVNRGLKGLIEQATGRSGRMPE